MLLCWGHGSELMVTHLIISFNFGIYFLNSVLLIGFQEIDGDFKSSQARLPLTLIVVSMTDAAALCTRRWPSPASFAFFVHQTYIPPHVILAASQQIEIWIVDHFCHLNEYNYIYWISNSMCTCKGEQQFLR